MPRRPRFEIAGVPQHVVQRGNNRKPIFVDDEDRRRYLDLAIRMAQKREVAVHAYALMGNHVHMLLTTRECGQCSGFMHDLGSTFVGWFNERHGRTGTLWEGRFRNCLVDSRTYLWNCHRYIEFNPVRAGLVSCPGEFPWSSFGANAMGRIDPLVTPRPEYAALGTSSSARCRAYREFVLVASETEEFAFARLRGGGLLGSEEFEVRTAAQLGISTTPVKRGRPRKRREENSEPTLIFDVV